MRLFAALDLPEDCLSAIDEWMLPLRERYDGLRWVRTGNMHLTLRFLGEVGEDTIRSVSTVLSAWEPGKLEFTLDMSGTFRGRDGAPKVYWLGGDFPESIFGAASLLGTVPDHRGELSRGRFQPHVSVARPRGDTPGPLCLPDPPVVSGCLSGPVLYESRLTGSGALYSVLERFDNGPPPDGGSTD